jgi:hypothetical protein
MQYQSVPDDSLEIVHNLRSSHVDGLTIEGWWFGSLFGPGDPIDIHLRISSIDTLGERQPSATVTTLVKDLQGTVVRQSVRNVSFGRTTRKSLLVGVYNSKGESAILGLNDAAWAWETELKDVVSTRAVKGGSVLPSGDYIMDVRIQLLDGPCCELHSEFEVGHFRE